MKYLKVLGSLLLAACWLGLFQAEALAVNKFITNQATSCTQNYVAACICSVTGSAGTCSGSTGLPAVGDILLCDANSGTGTFTMSAAPNSLTGLNFTNCSLTNWDNTATPQNFTFTTGSVTCATTSTAIKLGSATYDFTGAVSTAVTPWNVTCTAGDIQAGTSVIKYSGTVTVGGSRSMAGGGATYNTIWAEHGNVTIAGSNTIGEMKCDASGTFAITAGTTQTISGGNDDLNFAPANGAAACGLVSTTASQATITQAAGTNTLTWTGIKGIAFAGALASWGWTNSFDLGGNSGTGLTISAPSGGASGGSNGVIGQ